MAIVAVVVIDRTDPSNVELAEYEYATVPLSVLEDVI